VQRTGTIAARAGAMALAENQVGLRIEQASVEA